METYFVIMGALVSSGKPASKEVVYRNMYTFVCSLAAQHITANYQRTKSKDYWLLLQLNFGGAIAYYPSKIDAKERVLQSFGENWPAGLWSIAQKNITRPFQIYGCNHIIRNFVR